MTVHARNFFIPRAIFLSIICFQNAFLHASLLDLHLGKYKSFHKSDKKKYVFSKKAIVCVDNISARVMAG